MLRNASRVRAFEDDWQRRSPLDVETARKIFNELYLWARKLGRFTPQDPLEGIDVDLRVARALNGRKAAREHRAGA